MAIKDSTNYSYAWNTGATTAKLIVKPAISTDYIVTATEIATQCQGIDTVSNRKTCTYTHIGIICLLERQLKVYYDGYSFQWRLPVTSNAGTIGVVVLRLPLRWVAILPNIP
ncbi:MAG: hypothetical protein R2822_19390 [Spirosomataceae bacterium]